MWKKGGKVYLWSLLLTLNTLGKEQREGGRGEQGRWMEGRTERWKKGISRWRE